MDRDFDSFSEFYLAYRDPGFSDTGYPKEKGSAVAGGSEFAYKSCDCNDLLSSAISFWIFKLEYTDCFGNSCDFDRRKSVV